MASVKQEFQNKLEVRHDSKDFMFLIEDSEARLVSVVTAFRMADDVSSQYSTVDDVPSGVVEIASERGEVVIDT